MDHNKRKSALQERRAAEDLGARVQPGSGAPAFYKGDVRKQGDLRVECKTTSKKAYALKLSEIEKIKSEALMGGDDSWAMQIEFQTATAGKRFAVIDWNLFLEFRKLQADHEARMKSAADYMSSMAKADSEAEKTKYE